MGLVLGISVKRLSPCRYLDGHVKEPYEMSMAWEPDRKSNFYFSPPAHLCAVTHITEIWLKSEWDWLFNITCNDVSVLYITAGSSVGRVVKLLACGARGPGFDSRPRLLNFQRLVISASKSRYGWKIAKSTLIIKTTIQPICNCTSMCPHICNWNIVAYDVKQPISLARSPCLSMCRLLNDWNIVDCDVKQPISIANVF